LKEKKETFSEEIHHKSFKKRNEKSQKEFTMSKAFFEGFQRHLEGFFAMLIHKKTANKKNWNLHKASQTQISLNGIQETWSNFSNVRRKGDFYLWSRSWWEIGMGVSSLEL
jgi:hypothetical protein